MKKCIKKLTTLGVAILLFAGTAVTAKAECERSNSDEILPMVTIVENELIGAWQYTVPNAPPEYSKGIISISEQGGKFVVQVQLGQGVLNGENVSVSGNEINFNLLIEGGQVEVVLTADGDKISGKSTATDGVYNIEGERVKPQ